MAAHNKPTRAGLKMKTVECLKQKLNAAFRVSISAHIDQRGYEITRVVSTSANQKTIRYL